MDPSYPKEATKPPSMGNTEATEAQHEGKPQPQPQAQVQGSGAPTSGFSIPPIPPGPTVANLGKPFLGAQTVASDVTSNMAEKKQIDENSSGKLQQAAVSAPTLANQTSTPEKASIAIEDNRAETMKSTPKEPRSIAQNALLAVQRFRKQQSKAPPMPNPSPLSAPVSVPKASQDHENKPVSTKGSGFFIIRPSSPSEFGAVPGLKTQPNEAKDIETPTESQVPVQHGHFSTEAMLSQTLKSSEAKEGAVPQGESSATMKDECGPNDLSQGNTLQPPVINSVAKNLNANHMNNGNGTNARIDMNGENLDNRLANQTTSDNNIMPPRNLPAPVSHQTTQVRDRPEQDPPSFQMRELKVEDALNYLDSVKLEFGDRPRIYNEFLEIMKNFKAHEIDTPGVIMRVSDLFRGYNNLILGFNTFLPDGFKISIKDLVEGGRYASKKPPRSNDPPQSAMRNPMQQIGPGGPLPMSMGQQAPLSHMGGKRPNPSQVGPLQQIQGNREAWKFGHDQSQGMQGRQQAQLQPSPGQILQLPNAPPHQQQQQQQQQQQTQQQQQQQQQPAQSQGSQENPAIEFDHAITYVTTIKKRFANEPRTYQQFLEILHTYQKEQRGIREVLEQVSSLFADHPDLLKQFTYFLPEAVQEQAKERLHAAAAEAEARQEAKRLQATMEAPNHYTSQSPTTGHEVARSHGSAPRGVDQKIALDMTQKVRKITESNFLNLTETDPTLQQQAAGADTGAIPTTPATMNRPSSPSNVTLEYPMMPETLIYNAGVERQFFDMAKEALRSNSRDGELAWAEFLKCMDLYAQEVFSKNDMLRYSEDLLGKQHADLFEEFKRILAAAGATGAPSHDDAWHSVPLSEIDFSRCRRCTPSYRALPRDYPVAPFSGRSEEEAKMLNDVWISLPDGSEESYTFRHMRKNQHEEVLFRCEDERFEIDMVIDSTSTALQRLEPIADEIAMLQHKEIFSGRGSGSDAKDKSALKTLLESGGLAGKTIKYSFDSTILNTIHRHAIARVYGDAGEEMLDLMQKNPVVAIPVVVKRLKQKDRDFRAAREVLNRRWKELAEINYYKSIDHRSLTWRTVDKRATSTRTLAAEIKDRAANNGVESEVTFLAKRDKAKEEFGSFYEKTMGRYLNRKMDLTNLPKPTPSMFTPHYSMVYENTSWAQRDAYRILSFALERGSISPGDKERCHRVWTDFLAPFFELSNIWMQSPAVAYSILPHHTHIIETNADESGNDDGESSAEENEMVGDMMVTEEVMKDCSKSDSESMTGFNLLDNQPIPSGASVSTIFGEGIVSKYRDSDQSYVVSLPFGATAYLNRNAVLCTILPIDQFSDTDQSMISDETSLERDGDKFMLGPQSLYLFFRLHQVLIRRLNIARKLAFSVDKDQSLCTLIEQMTQDGNAPIGQKRYDAYLSLVYGLLEGGLNSSFQGGSANAAEGGKYEDRVRCLLGHGSYELATMDKLVSHILKHLQNMANDETMQGMIQIFKKHLDSRCFKPLGFRQEAAMVSEGENIFAFQYCQIPKMDKTIMHVEFLGSIVNDEDDDSMASLPESNDGPALKKVRR